MFQSGLVTMVPLEVTHTALATPDVLARLQALDTPFATMLIKLLLHFQSSYESVFGLSSPVSVRERNEKERKRETERDRETERQRDRERETERGRERARHPIDVIR